MKSSYDESLKRLLAHEGGYTNDPRDPGGPTNWGITIYDARKYWKENASAADVRNMPLNVAKDIYKAKYWDAIRGDDLPAGVDDTVFDYAVNSGLGRAPKVLQRVLGVTADGKIGDKTLGAALGMDPTHVIESVNDERLRFLRSLRTWNHFGIGWGRRVQEVRSFSLQLAEAAKRQHPAPPAPTVSPTVGKAIDGDFVDVPRTGIASWFNSLFKGK